MLFACAASRTSLATATRQTTSSAARSFQTLNGRPAAARAAPAARGAPAGRRPPAPPGRAARRALSAAPKWSFHGRPLPEDKCVPLDGPCGRKRFERALVGGTAENHFKLANQFLTQSSPPSCGVTTLAMVMNALAIDPNVRWKGGWRWFDEAMVLGNCCKAPEEVDERGITMHEFASMARCHGAVAEHWHHEANAGEGHGACGPASLATFRRHVVASATSSDPPLVVASFDRSALGQTGAGHFSPLSAYDVRTDSVLVLDVARFKYPPWWVALEHLYDAMEATDADSGFSRGYFRVSPKIANRRRHAQRDAQSDGGGGGSCPAHSLMRSYCPLEVRKKCKSSCASPSRAASTLVRPPR